MAPCCFVDEHIIDIRFHVSYLSAWSLQYTVVVVMRLQAQLLNCFIFSCFFIPFHSIRIVSLHFQAGCRRRWLNLALVFVCVAFVLNVFLDACFFCRIWFSFFLRCVVVFPCCRLYHNNLNEFLDPFPFLGSYCTKRRPGLRLIYRWPSFTG